MVVYFSDGSKNMAQDYLILCSKCRGSTWIKPSLPVGQPSVYGSLLVADLNDTGVLNAVCRLCYAILNQAPQLERGFFGRTTESSQSSSDDSSSSSSSSLDSTDSLATRFDALEKRVSVLERRQARRFDMRRYHRLGEEIKPPTAALRLKPAAVSTSPSSQPRGMPRLRLKIGKYKSASDRFEDDKSGGCPTPPPPPPSDDSYFLE